ncbi:MAG: BON domain-containing protein [Thiohalomonadaceae bacterium]|jgi:osmotically-inducible protein OsmY
MKYLLAVFTVVFLLQGCAPVLVGTAAVGAVAVVDDNRTTGTIIDDKAISIKSGNLIRNDEEMRGKTHINVTSFNGIVLLSGEVASANHRAKAEKLTYTVPKVRQVINEISVAPISSMASRSSDSWITSKVKSQLFAEKNVPGNQIKVFTEAQTVYLMGLVTQQQGERASEIARHTSKVKRVVKLFEYIEPGAE